MTFRQSTRPLIALLLSLLPWTASPASADTAVAKPLEAGRLEFFEKRIRPVLVSECQECHGPEKQKGGLRVDSRAGLLRGGESGPALVPGDVSGSRLIAAVRHERSELAMPKDRPKLPESVVADLATWIDQGATDPRDTPSAGSAPSATAWESTFVSRSDWWSFKPVRDFPVPKVRNADGSPQPVDRFLRAKMEARGLEPAPATDRRTLLRRVSFVLTGLPPTPEEARAFEEDSSSEAYPRVVDRLMASPRFGEQWARHWMDLMRFAETHGSEGDPDIPNAWRYRDYLIRAFNDDVPWDRLIREHLAGDLLPEPRWNRAEGINESVLGLAHFRLVEHGFNPVDTLDEQVKTVDSQIDVVSKAFQGLTTACARCHNHKFDPISDRDYYALAGILSSIRPTQLSIDDPALLRSNRVELGTLKSRIRTHLADAWTRAAQGLPTVLGSRLPERGGRYPIEGDAVQDRITELAARIAGIDQAGYATVLKTRGAGTPGLAGPQPLAVWTFEGDLRDSVGTLHGEPEGSAQVRNGRLVLDGQGAFVRSAPLSQPLQEKTLEAWVYPANLGQRGGGLLTVETLDGSVFDSLVFGEMEPRRWMAGSEGFQRTRSAGGPEETSKSDRRIHVAAVYGADNRITLYRDGVAYGTSYVPAGSSLRTFDAGSSRVLLGKRHTGGGNPYFAGELEEVRLHGRALTTEEIAESFRAGPGLVSPEAIVLALTPEQKARRQELTAGLESARSEMASRYPDHARRDAERTRLLAALAAAGRDPGHPLHAWFQLRTKGGSDFTSGWEELVRKEAEERTARQRGESGGFLPVWRFGGKEADGWFRHGANPPETPLRPGEFSVEPEGQRILVGLLPAGAYSHLLSQRHNGVLASPRFQVTNRFISVRVVGGKGARVRLIPDNYPIGQGNIFPQANLNSDAPTWVRLDTAYRKGSMAYLELATAEEVTSRDRSASGPGGRSFFGIDRVVFHDDGTPAPDPGPGTSWTTGLPAPGSLEVLADRLRDRLLQTLNAWREGTLDEVDRAFLDSFVRAGILPTRLEAIPELAPEVAEYRRLESAIPLARRVPGVVEGTTYDTPLLARGDPTKPQETIPRGYLRLVSGKSRPVTGSGRLELAESLVSTSNPLTARVLVNRVWHQVFGRGLVGTVDNFGRLGDQPTHPELLDHLAVRFVDQHWSLKALLRELVLTRAFQASSQPPAQAAELDPANELLSHARVRRLEAESVRDTLLSVSGRLDTAMYGPGTDALAPAASQSRRSLYLTVRRNFLSPFLEVFDFPRPFTTLGRRDATNVPAQSLALLNDPFVLEQADQWAGVLLQDGATAETRIRRMYETAFCRPPDASEITASLAFLAELEQAHGAGAARAVWRDYAQSLFNLKEFLYLR